MEIYVARNGQQAGPSSPQEVRSLLNNRSIDLNDLAWYEGAANRVPLSSIPEISAGGAPPLLRSKGLTKRHERVVVYSDSSGELLRE